MGTYAGGFSRNGVDWDYYDRYESIVGKYMPFYGEGETIASQIVTAINKLVYKWYNDGDVFDNSYHLEGWANDLSSYANWLYNHDYGCRILDGIRGCKTHADYENLLKDLADMFLGDEELLENLNTLPMNSSIYKAVGVFKFVDRYEDEDDEENIW